MRAHVTSRTRQSRRLWTGIAGAFAVAGLLVIAVCSRPGVGVSFAQSASTQSEAAQAEASTAQPSSAAEAKTAENKPVEPQASAATAQAPAQDQTAKQEAGGQPEGDGQPAKLQPANPQQAELMDDSANLLKLANSLKAAVDKTTQDTLSLAVIRQADEIERLARKMRTR